MAIRKIARLGHPILRQPARELSPSEIGAPEFLRLVADMKDTMAEYGGIGLAAPQIHEPLQVAIIGFEARTPVLGFNVPEAVLLGNTGRSLYNSVQLGLSAVRDPLTIVLFLVSGMLLWSGTLGSNLTVSGAPALYVALSLAEKEENRKVSLREFLSWSIPFTLVCSTMCYILGMLIWVLPYAK